MAWRLTAAVAALLFVASVQAQDSGPYLGASYGRARAKIDTGPLDAEAAGTTGTPVTVTQDQHNAGKLFLGYRINKNFAIEGGYADLGQFAAASTGIIQFTHVIPPAPPTTVTIVTTENFTIKAKGVFVSGLGGIPFLEGGLAYAKLGLYSMTVDVTSETSSNCQGNGCAVAGRPLSDSNVGPLFGAGLQYMTPWKVGFRAEWERFNNVGGDNTGRHNFDLFTLGVMFRF